MKNNKVIIPFFAIMFVAVILIVGLSIKGQGQSEKIAANKNNPSGAAENVKFEPTTAYGSTCASCHGANLEGGVGPSLKGVKDRHSTDELKGILKNGKGIMPANLLKAENIEEMVQYLETL